MSEAVVRFVFRMPADLHAAINAWAKAEERSLHAQMLYLLRRAVADRGK